LVPAIGLGCMGMSAFYSRSAEDQSQQVLDRSLELGCNFWDTARIYADNEEFLSATVKKNRDKIFLCTKFGFDAATWQVNGTRDFIRKQFEESCHKLGVDVIDLYYQHRVDKNTPIEETVKAMAELVKEGKVKYLGLSECSAETLRRAYAVHPIAAVQVEYSPWCTEIETNGLLQACRELGVAIVAYSPLGRGFLTGQIKSIDDLAPDDWRRSVPRFQGENFAKNLELLKEFEKIAAKKKVSPGQLCLAWILAQGEDFILIPGTKKLKYLEENVGAAQVHITRDEDYAVRQLIDSIPVSGDRYPENMMGGLFV